MPLAISANDKHNFRKVVNHLLKARAKPFDEFKARNIVSFTYRLGGVSCFLEVTTQEMVHRDCKSVWKYCHLLHMALRDGPRQFYNEALQLRQSLCGIDNRWEAMGQSNELATCILLYCRALLHKLAFHQSYEFFNGNLDAEDTHQWDANLCFQLCCDILDYAEELLLLQSAIVANTTRTHQTNAATQLLLESQPLATIAGELAALHGLALKMMSILCPQLPLDVMSDLYNRFCFFHQAIIDFCIKMRQFNITIKLSEMPQLFVNPTGFQAPNVAHYSPVAPTAPAESDM